MTGWILCDRVWRQTGDPSGPSMREGTELFLVLGPVPTRPPHTHWTLLNMQTSERVTLNDRDVRNVFRFKRLA